MREPRPDEWWWILEAILGIAFIATLVFWLMR